MTAIFLALLGFFQTYLNNLPTGLILALAIFAYFFTHPEQFQKWAGMIAWLVSWVYKNAEYYAIKNEFQGRLNGFVSTLEANSAIQIPKASIRFTATGEKEEFAWEEGEAILVMHDKKHRTKNFVHAAYFYTTEVLLRKSKLHLSKKQKESLDLFSTKQVLEGTYKAAVEQFMTDYFIPHIEHNEDIRQLIAQYDPIDKKGLYFPILIQELTYLGHKVFLKKPTTEVMTEVTGLIKFLEDYSTRGDGNTRIPENFVGKYTRCAIRVVASSATRERGVITGHRNRLVTVVREGFENIYLLGIDSWANRSFMHRVVDAVIEEMPHVLMESNRRIKGRIKTHGVYKSVSTYLVHLHNPSAIKYLYSEEDLQGTEEPVESHITAADPIA